MKILTGTSGWSYESWKDVFYPAGIKSEKYLKYYSSLYKTVEIDSTFYNIPDEKTITKWRDSTPSGFLFCPKMFQRITHEMKLIGSEKLVNKFVESMALLKDKLGIILIQMPPSLKFRDKKVIIEFLNSLPSGFKYAIEFRDISWFSDYIYSLLEKHNITIAWSDTPFVPRNYKLTDRNVYLRLIGDRSINESEFGKISVNKEKSIEGWASKLKEMEGEFDHAFVFANNHYQGFAPGTINLLRSQTGMEEIKFPVPDVDKTQKTLF